MQAISWYNTVLAIFSSAVGGVFITTIGCLFSASGGDRLKKWEAGLSTSIAILLICVAILVIGKITGVKA